MNGLFCIRKAQAACSEWEEDGAPDVEVLFTSQEGAKPPTILAAGAGHLEKRSRLSSPVG